MLSMFYIETCGILSAGGFVRQRVYLNISFLNIQRLKKLNEKLSKRQKTFLRELKLYNKKVLEMVFYAV